MLVKPVNRAQAKGSRKAGRGGVGRAFTLVEALAALVLFALTAAALISLLVFHIRVSNLLERTRTASQLATSRMEQLNRMPSDQVILAVEDRAPLNENGDPNAEGPYFRSTSFALDADGNITITVIVESGGGSFRPAASFELISARSGEAESAP